MVTRSSTVSGFTLIEILIAIAIIAISFTTLLGVHIRNVEMGAATVEITVASIIAREQIEKARLGTLSIKSDTFEERTSDHNGFFWGIRSFPTVLPGVKEVQVIVYKKTGEKKKDPILTLSTYLL